jgi:hemolysin-activating ACP:hemolysin acyltransferase
MSVEFESPIPEVGIMSAFGLIPITPAYAKQPAGITLERFGNCILDDRCRIMTENGLCTGIVTWMHLAPHASAIFKNATRQLSAEEMRSGSIPWICDLIAPYGNGDKLLRHAVDMLHKQYEATVFAMRYVDGRLKVVSYKYANTQNSDGS